MVTKRKVGGTIAASAAALVVGMLAAVPLLATAIGVFEFAARIQGTSDPTWNDGDLGISLLAALAMIALLGIAAGIGWMCGRLADIPGARMLWMTATGAFLVACIAAALITGVPFRLT